MGAIVGENGDLLFPKRGSPPRSVEGYDRDGSDPYVFHPQWEACTHRYERSFVCSSGKTRYRTACKLLNRDVTYNVCEACDKREEPVCYDIV